MVVGPILFWISFEEREWLVEVRGKMDVSLAVTAVVLRSKKVHWMA